MGEDKISRLYLLFIFYTTIGLKNHLIIIPPLSETAGRDAWITVIFSIALHILWLFLIYYIYKKMNGIPIYQWIMNRVGKVTAMLICLSIGIVLLLLATHSITELGKWTSITYLPFTPDLLIMVIFAILCLLTTLTNLRTIAILNGVLLPVIVLLGFFVMFANMPNKDASLLLPILEKGYMPVFSGIVYSSAGLGEMVMILFIQHRLKNQVKYWQLLLFTLFVSILIIGPLTAGYMEFGVEELKRLRFPTYEQWALISMGRFIEHVDFLSIFQWLAGSFIRISFLIYLITQVIPISNRKWKNMFVIGLYSIVLSITQLPKSDMEYLAFVNQIFLPGTLIYFISLTVTLVVISFIPESQKEVKRHETA
ncbi:GerAB/ArcD/ProY family transporter [Salipaludibacillus daqingensis]|uniref:GerAB/ArcD/ProY family transporter n=1 Tax=Salipaludibacillus daqingensis TaxID=3041001 RepID=UPI00247535B0|nr:endospore germination permease [Salipaludibacillus daqingensis]